MEQQYIKIRGANEHNLKNIDLDIVLFIFIQCDILGQFVDAAIYLNSHISASSCLFKQLLMRSFSASDDRRQQLDLRPLR